MVPENSAGAYELIVDSGACDWYYAGVLATHFPRARILGVEADGGRRYLDLFRRKDLGISRALALRDMGRDVEYRHQDFRALTAKDLGGFRKIFFTFFFPFVSKEPCLAWGLPPSRFASFETLLQHVGSLSREIGSEVAVLSVHQGEWEASIAAEALQANCIDVRELTLAPEEIQAFWPASHPIWCFSARVAARVGEESCP